MAKHPMVGRYGPRRAWWPWEIELLKGAMCEEDDGDTQAIRDCAELLCRKYEAVREKARQIEDEARRQMRLARIPMPFKYLSTWLQREHARAALKVQDDERIERVLKRHGVKSHDEEADRPARSARAIDAIIADLRKARGALNGGYA